MKVSAIHFELPDDREHRSTLPDLSDLIGSFLAAFDGADGAKGCDGQLACRHARNKRDHDLPVEAKRGVSVSSLLAIFSNEAAGKTRGSAAFRAPQTITLRSP